MPFYCPSRARLAAINDRTANMTNNPHSSAIETKLNIASAGGDPP